MALGKQVEGGKSLRSGVDPEHWLPVLPWPPTPGTGSDVSRGCVYLGVVGEEHRESLGTLKREGEPSGFQQPPTSTSSCMANGRLRLLRSQASVEPNNVS